ncbi:MAG: hypothetical protein HY060_00280 [Proteobacteria bacterium]|nr:hypothetical protein [Pseudomonadota bacterium]
MANLSQLIEAAVAEWRDGRPLTSLRGAPPAVIEFDEFEVLVTLLPAAAGAPLAVSAAVMNGDGETLAEARVEVKDA